jgi:AI-2 transport protein TqsA
MPTTPEPASPPAPAAAAPLRSRRDWQPLIIAAAVAVLAASSWYLLKELAPLLRPLVLAMFLCYIVVPMHLRLRRHVSTTISIALLAGASVLVVGGLAVSIYSNAVQLNAELPRLIRRGQAIFDSLREFTSAHLPSWVADREPSDRSAEAETIARLRWFVAELVNMAAGVLAEAVVVGFYMVFLLMATRRFPERVRAAFSSVRSERILEVINSINAAMAGYLRVKTLASLLLAVPFGLLLWAFGVRFAITWGLLAFVGNFIPYVGSFIALVLPVLLAFVELEPIGKPVVLLALLLVNQFVNNNIVEPLLTARAVNLTPVVVLIALGFWGLCWGITGMFLAVPLTVMLKVIGENIAVTRPLARLLAEG